MPSNLQEASPLKSKTRSVRSVSPHYLQSWERCQRQFDYQHVQELRWPSDTRNFTLGKHVHKLLDYQARGLDCEPLVVTATPDIQKAWQLLMAHETAHAPIVASEWGFQFPVTVNSKDLSSTGRGEVVAEAAPKLTNSVRGEAEDSTTVWNVGRIDRIIRAENGQVWVLDWKTGTAIPRNPSDHWQTILYLLAVLAAKDDLGLPDLTPEQLQFVYVGVNESVQMVHVPFSQVAYEAYWARLHQTLQQILSAETFNLPNKCPDPYCPYDSICGINHDNFARQ